MLTKQQIFSAKVKTTEVATPEWGDGGSVYVRKLNGSQLGRVQELLELHGKASTNGKAMSDMELMAELCVIFVCTKDGKQVFAPAEVSKLLDGPFAPMDRCFDEGLAFNNLTEDSMAKVRSDVKKKRGVARG